MENMIRRIVDADNKAKAMEEVTLKEKEQLSKNIDAEIEQIHKNYMSKAEETVKRRQIIEEKKANQQWNEIKNKHRSVLIKLKSDFDRNSEKWINDIVNRTIEN